MGELLVESRILILPGDGIGPEIVAAAVQVLQTLINAHGLCATIEHGLIGGMALEATGSPLPPETIEQAEKADAILLGAVGGPKWDGMGVEVRPERGLLGLRVALGLFANLRPAKLYPDLVRASPLRPEVVNGLDILIVRELTGDVYYGEPRGHRALNGERQAFNTMLYTEAEIRRIAEVAFALAATRRGHLCSIDKANVLEVSQLWRAVVTETGRDHPEVELSHMYVDNAAMQLVKNPRQFDVLLTPNLFGDILSDLAAMLTGSIGMLPSASLGPRHKGLYEPIHGSAPDLVGSDTANPLATILSLAMMLRHSLAAPELALKVERAVQKVLSRGLRTVDIDSGDTMRVGTAAMGAAVAQAL